MQFSGLADFCDPEISSPRTPQIFLILAADETLEVDAPDHIARMHEIQRRKRDANCSRPALGSDAGFRGPHAIPTGVAIAAVGSGFVCDEAVTLGA